MAHIRNLKIRRLKKQLTPLWSTYHKQIRKLERQTDNRWIEISTGTRQNWIWESYLMAMITSGGSGHAEKVKFVRKQFVDRCDYDPLCWNELLSYDRITRQNWMSIAANPHFQRHKKLKSNLLSFIKAHRKTGLCALQSKIQNAGKAEAIEILKSLGGLGEKYCRNIMMDIGHENFKDCCFALDSRINNFLKEITGMTATYSSKSKTKWTENDLIEIAHELNMTAWQMDKLIYNFG